jgi:hypothetical protein
LRHEIDLQCLKTQLAVFRRKQNPLFSGLIKAGKNKSNHHYYTHVSLYAQLQILCKITADFTGDFSPTYSQQKPNNAGE